MVPVTVRDHGHHPIIHRIDGDLDPEDPQDMRNMGGLLKRMPITGWTFIIGGLALSGFPFVTVGFWSKDEILSSTWHTEDQLIFWMLALSAILTGFYTARQITLTFLTKPRTVRRGACARERQEYDHSVDPDHAFCGSPGLVWYSSQLPVFGGIAPNLLERILEP